MLKLRFSQLSTKSILFFSQLDMTSKFIEHRFSETDIEMYTWNHKCWVPLESIRKCVNHELISDRQTQMNMNARMISAKLNATSNLFASMEMQMIQFQLEFIIRTRKTALLCSYVFGYFSDVVWFSMMYECKKPIKIEKKPLKVHSNFNWKHWSKMKKNKSIKSWCRWMLMMQHFCVILFPTFMTRSAYNQRVSYIQCVKRNQNHRMLDWSMKCDASCSECSFSMANSSEGSNLILITLQILR